LARSSIG